MKGKSVDRAKIAGDSSVWGPKDLEKRALVFSFFSSHTHISRVQPTVSDLTTIDCWWHCRYVLFLKVKEREKRKMLRNDGSMCSVDSFFHSSSSSVACLHDVHCPSIGPHETSFACWMLGCIHRLLLSLWIDRDKVVPRNRDETACFHQINSWLKRTTVAILFLTRAFQ